MHCRNDYRHTDQTIRSIYHAKANSINIAILTYNHFCRLRRAPNTPATSTIRAPAYT